MSVRRPGKSSDSWRGGNTIDQVSGQSDVFVSHDWSVDETSQHRLSLLNRSLQKRGVITWFDGDEGRGRDREMVQNGLNNTRTMLMCVTENYCTQVPRKKMPGDCDLSWLFDWLWPFFHVVQPTSPSPLQGCDLEFDYGLNVLGEERVLVVIMDPKMTSQTKWRGRLGSIANISSVVDLSNSSSDSTFFSANAMYEKKMDDLAERIKVRSR